MRRRYVQIDGQLIEVGLDYVPEPRAEHHVIPDIEPFKDTTGTVITGRAAWREHLRARDSMEMGHSDIAAMQRDHAKRRDAYAARMARAAKEVRIAPEIDVERAPAVHPRIAARVAERLEGRPQPERKTLIKIALEEAKRSR